MCLDIFVEQLFDFSVRGTFKVLFIPINPTCVDKSEGAVICLTFLFLKCLIFRCGAPLRCSCYQAVPVPIDLAVTQTPEHSTDNIWVQHRKTSREGQSTH